MTTYRMIPPGNGGGTGGYGLSGTYYSGAVIDVATSDVPSLQAQHWNLVAPSGTTANRPALSSFPEAVDGLWRFNPPAAGQTYLDTTLGKLIVSDGFVWHDPSTGAIV